MHPEPIVCRLGRRREYVLSAGFGYWSCAKTTTGRDPECWMRSSHARGVCSASCWEFSTLNFPDRIAAAISWTAALIPSVGGCQLVFRSDGCIAAALMGVRSVGDFNSARRAGVSEVATTDVIPTSTAVVGGAQEVHRGPKSDQRSSGSQSADHMSRKTMLGLLRGEH